jgi:flagellar hook-associated protein 1 FlgK
MSLSSILGIARSALLAHQRAMQVTAHNVANAQTPGYTRQRVD